MTAGVLLIAEVPIYAGSQFDGLACSTVNTARQARVIAIHRHGTDTLQLPAPSNHLLTKDDRLIVLATRTGLAGILTRSVVTPTAAP